MFDDGREERLEAAMLEIRLRRNPAITPERSANFAKENDMNWLKNEWVTFDPGMKFFLIVSAVGCVAIAVLMATQ